MFQASLIKLASAVGPGGAMGEEVGDGDGLVPGGEVVVVGVENVGITVGVEVIAGEVVTVDETVVIDVPGEAIVVEELPVLTQPATKPIDNRITAAKTTAKILIIFSIRCIPL